MWKRPWIIGGVLGGLLPLLGVPAAAEQEEAVFEMEEVSVFEQGEWTQLRSAGLATRGHYVSCSFVRPSQVKKYPELNSSRPIYGSVVFGQDPTDPEVGVRFYFVIDESQPGESETADSQSLMKSLAVALAGAPDTSGTNRKYSLLYFDANGDLDLTNDPVVRPMKDPPSLLGSSSQEVVFDYLNVRFDHGGKLGTRPLKVLPRLRVYGSTRAYATFTAAAARKGSVKLGDQQFTALLTQTVITGRFDRPYTGLALIPADASGKVFRGSSGQNYLSTLRWAKGEFYEISATPTGDKLTVAPYRGDSGLLKVDPGDRQGIEKLGVSGTLRSQERFLPVGDIGWLPPAENLPEHKIPVGDYTPMSLSVDFGKLAVSFSQNYYSKDEPHARMSNPPAGTLKIRKDKPFVLDFSNKPAVLFTSPGKGQTFRPGDYIRLRAAVIDPELNLLVRGLDDTTQKIGQRTYRIGGETVTVPRYASLAPTVTIADPSGKQVAQGKMPFG